MTQEVWERYGDETAAGATPIFSNDKDFVNAAAEFDAARAEESTVRSGNLYGHVTGNMVEC